MRIAVIGAGLAGLAAARQALAHPTVEAVSVFDKGRSVGGRMATRRIGAARLDHGAQFFTVRSDDFADQVADWVDRGQARIWCHGFGNVSDGHPRYIGTDGMNALAKDLARDLDVHTDHRVFTADRSDDGWQLRIDDGTVHHADALISTCPIAQSWALLAPGGYDGVPEALWRSPYQPVVGLLVVLDRPGAVPAPGGVQFDPTDADAPLGFIGDNHAKGISPIPAITVHATQPWSAEHIDERDESIRASLLERARPWLGDAEVVEAQVKRWRLATPTTPWPEPCFVDQDARLALAGDLFSGPRVEAAYLSGRRAAEAICSRPGSTERS